MNAVISSAVERSGSISSVKLLLGLSASVGMAVFVCSLKQQTMAAAYSALLILFYTQTLLNWNLEVTLSASLRSSPFPIRGRLFKAPPPGELARAAGLRGFTLADL